MPKLLSVHHMQRGRVARLAGRHQQTMRLDIHRDNRLPTWSSASFPPPRSPCLHQGHIQNAQEQRLILPGQADICIRAADHLVQAVGMMVLRNGARHAQLATEVHRMTRQLGAIAACAAKALQVQSLPSTSISEAFQERQDDVYPLVPWCTFS